MARIRFNISAALTRWRVRETASPSRFRMMDLQALHERPRGPGWFDSSWDLDQGLEVEIAVPGDPPFQAWIEAQARALVSPLVPPHVPPAAALHAATPVEGLLEFEPVDWRAWAPPPSAGRPLAGAQPEGLDMPELSLEGVGLELVCAPGPALELALV